MKTTLNEIKSFNPFSGDWLLAKPGRVNYDAEIDVMEFLESNGLSFVLWVIAHKQTDAVERFTQWCIYEKLSTPDNSEYVAFVASSAIRASQRVESHAYSLAADLDESPSLAAENAKKQQIEKLKELLK